jgi:hypothetical protein
MKRPKRIPLAYAFSNMNFEEYDTGVYILEFDNTALKNLAKLGYLSNPKRKRK